MMSSVSWVRVFVALVCAAFIALIVLAAMVWVLAVVAVFAGFIWVDMVLVPRTARRFGVPRLILDALVVVALIGGGYWVGGATGMAVAGALWLGGIAATRLGYAWLRSHTRVLVVGRPEPPPRVLELVPCPRCGVASVDSGEGCPACGAGPPALAG